MATINTWYEAYSQIAELLDKFYNENKENTAKAIYSRFKDSAYKVLNPANLFQHEHEVKELGLDPIQILASFNYPRITNSYRIEVINSLFRVLGSDDLVSESTSFEGIPAPVITRITYFRGWTIQNRIWGVFHRIKEEGINGLLKNSFEILEDWNGIDIVSFTMFLFWVNSDIFLPLDRNTVKFLIANNIIRTTPRTINMYKSLCTKKTVLRITNNFDLEGAFRKIVKEAYGFSDNKAQEIILSGTTASIISSYSEKYKSKEEIEEDNRRKSIDSQRSFKIIAIRPLIKEDRTNENNKQKHLKNLIEGQLYQFYHEYIFDDPSDMTIKYDKQKEISLYNYTNKNTGKNVKISISAIVGKNGSGKSAIVELIYLIVNKLSYIKEIETSEELLDEEIFADLFVHSDRLYKISIGKKVTIHSYNLNADGNTYLQNEKKLNNITEFDIENFCYSVIINYSLYSLNTNIMGDWIYPLFHKNDSYQVPIVLNPLRRKGNIDVNNEEHLTKSRLLSNILEPDRINFESNEVPDIVPGKTPETLKLEIDTDKIERKKKDYTEKYKLDKDKRIDKLQINKVINQLGINNILADKYVDECQEYIFMKLESIAENYPKYSEYKELTTWVDKDETKLKKYCWQLNDDDSHITFKLKQAINYLKHKIYFPEKNSPIIDLARTIKQLKTNQGTENTELYSSKLRTIDLMPPSFLKINMNFKGAGEFSELSSGEKQQIFSINNITYQLFNLNSVEKGPSSLTYHNVNIIFDEVELYFHPDMQRSYIQNLRNRIIELELDKIDNINIIFVTHSPFILSDLPANNIILLEEGKPKPWDFERQTLGANIHDLLTYDFFMQNGFMGEWAKQKIQSLMNYLTECIKGEQPTNLDWNEENIKPFIALIGEPLIKDSLTDMYEEAFLKTNELIIEEIERLQGLLKPQQP